MTFESLKQNVNMEKDIMKDLYIFTNQLEMIKDSERDREVIINTSEKKLLEEAIGALEIQLKIINNSIPELIKNVGFFKELKTEDKTTNSETKLVKVQYKPEKDEDLTITIGDKDRARFLENLSKSNLSINKLKDRKRIEKPLASFGKPNKYAKISNKYFRDYSTKLISSGYFNGLNESLRKMNSPFVLSTYVSMIFFTITLSLIIGFILLAVLLFFNVSLNFPFFSLVQENIFLRFAKVFWIIIAIPSATGLIMYIYPSSESKNIGKKIDQELPFITIHMSSIAAAEVEPIEIFKIILKNEEYRHTNPELRKLINLINLQGYDIITALKTTAKSSPSQNLKELLDGMATAITSGGNLNSFLNEHAESLLFDYRLERERYIKTSETFMDIYISIVIAAPMILLTLFVIIGTTCMTLGGLTTDVMNLLIFLGTAVLNVGFLVFLKLKQPVF
jgi:pilus assembly protein TadC